MKKKGESGKYPAVKRGGISPEETVREMAAVHGGGTKPCSPTDY